MASPHAPHGHRSRSVRQARRPSGVLPALAAACLWGTTGTTQALMTGHHSPVAVGGLRVVIAAVVLVSLAVTGDAPGLLAVARAGRRIPLLAAALGVACYQLSFFAAVQRSGVGVGTLVMLACAPATAGLAGWALGQGRPTRGWALATLVALAGAALLVLGAGNAHRLDAGGLALAALAGAGFAAYSVAGRLLTADGQVSATSATGAVFPLAALVLAVPLARQDLGFLAAPRNLALLAWLGVMATAAAYLLYQRSMRTLGAATAASLALAEPMVANLLAVVVLHEAFTVTMGLGVALVLFGLGLLART